MLKFMESPAFNPKLVACAFTECGAADRIGLHPETERRYKCHACRRTFAATRGTSLYDLKYPVWVVALVLSLLAWG